MLGETVEECEESREESVSDECFKHRAPSTDEKLSELLNNISFANTKPSVLSLVHPYSYNYVPKALQKTFPKPLKSLHDPSYIILSTISY